MGKTKNILLFSLLIFFGLLALSQKTQAQTVVDASSIQSAINSASSGSTIQVNAGTFSGRVTVNKSVTVRAQGTVTVTGGFSISGSNATVEGFEIPGSASRTTPEIDLSGSGNVIRGNHISSGNSYSNDHPVIEISGQNNVAENNEIGPMHDIDAFRIFGSGHTVRCNYIHDTSTSSGSQAHMDVFQVFGDNNDTSYNIIFESNFIQNWGGQMFMTERADAYPNANIHDWDVRNNVWVNVEAQGNIGIPNFRFYNNTLYRAGYNYGDDFALLTDSGDYQRMNATGAKIKNNIFVGVNSNMEIYSRDVGHYGEEVDHNIFRVVQDIASLRFVNASNADFHLQSGSEAIDAGIVLSGFNNDKEGNTRPAGSAWDIGAYEFGATGGSGCGAGSGGGGGGGPTPTPNPNPTPTPTPTPPRTYTITDFTSLVSNWLRTVTSSTANVNADGRVNTRDLGIMMSNWQ